jgi:pimeloyl-ACP methyl ester carboxylesterase
MPLSGGDLAFTMAGTAPAALLLIHGLGGSRQTWRHLLPALARTHTVIAPDLPGHGESDPRRGTIHWVHMPVPCAICCSHSDIAGPH